MKQIELDRKLTEAKPVEAPKNKPGVPLAPGRDKVLKKEREDKIKQENAAQREASKPKKAAPRKPSKPAVKKQAPTNDQAVDSEMQDLKAQLEQERNQKERLQ